MKPLSLSIVIPVYNEESHLPACLEAIAAQVLPPDEVIVVDNNSTDRSVEIAKSFPFVTVLHEKRQHQTFAQATGFNHAASDILGRIDADTVISPDWVQTVKREFAARPAVSAISGDGELYGITMRRAGTIVFRIYHEYISAFCAGHPLMWGANCALRADAWLKIRGKMSYRTDVWEDHEMAFLIAEFGQIRFVKKLKAACSFKVSNRSVRFFIGYEMRAIRVFHMYRPGWRTALFGTLWWTILLLAPLKVVDDFFTRHDDTVKA